MKYKKWYLILPICLLLVTGCDVTYQIEFQDDKIIETNTFYLPNSELENDDIVTTLEKKALNYTMNTDFLISPKTDIIREENQTGYAVTNEYSYNDYSTIDNCYDAFNIIKKDGTVTISTSNQFQCFQNYNELNQVKIMAKVNYKVSQHNADEVKKNTYIWYIDKNNAASKPIHLVFNLNQKINNFAFTNWQTYVIVIASFVIIVLLVIWMISKISKKNNQI